MTVTGPVTGGAHGWPFGASVRDLRQRGYVEEEFFLDGDAVRYSLDEGSDYGYDGRWEAVPRAAIPIATRFLVRRPARRAQFNGIVVVGWNNVSVGYENVAAPMDEVIDSGCAWVAASVQSVGVHGRPGAPSLGLGAWDAVRYGTRSLPDDDASFDTFTQIARAVGPARDRAGVDPMAGFDVEHVLAFGASQSANRLATYHNAIQPLTRAFEGFLLAVYSGGGTRLDARGPGPSPPQIPPEARALVNLLPFGSHLLRDDVDAKVVVVNSETEAPWYFPVRQPDDHRYRLWEVAGTAHAGLGSRADAEAQALRDFGTTAVRDLQIPARPNPNTLSFGPVIEAALHHLQEWAATGSPPPVQDRIEFAGDPPRIVRDEHGNARGGIRLPDLDVPVATHVGESPDGVPDLTGASTPFPADLLHALYPDPADFAARRDASVAAGVARGYLLGRHVDGLRASAPGSVP